MSTGDSPPGEPPPTDPAPDDEAHSSRTETWVAVLAVTLVVIVIVIVAVVTLSGDDDQQAGPSEILLVSAASTGVDPFTASVDDPTNPPADPTTGEVPSNGGDTAEATTVSATSGGEPGLYGGTRDNTSCDKAKLTEFLLGDEAKASAWAGVRGIAVDEIATYIDGLTPILLTADTRVTNHGFKNGKATATNAVLQEGSAVLVDDSGDPVARCACGNPLDTPKQVADPTYHGQQWAGWNTTEVAFVQPTPTPIAVFVLVDVETGEQFGRPAGTDGPDDTDDPGTTVVSDGSTTTSTQTPGATGPFGLGSEFAESAILLAFFPDCRDTDFPFPTAVLSYRTLSLSEDGTRWRVSVTGSSAEEGFEDIGTWIVELPSGDLTPDDAGAQEAAQYCPALG